MKTSERLSALAPAIAIGLALFVSACGGNDTNETASAATSKVTTEGGLILEDITVGEGEAAAEASPVAVHYTGWLFDETKPENKGLEFDSSLKRNKQFEFVLGQGSVIKGWDQGVVGMKVGGKRRLVIPSELGYGQHGSGKIPPSSTLIFDVELLAIDSTQIIEQVIGSGDVAVIGARVSVDYTGWLFDEEALSSKGKKFDSSVDRGNKFDFVLGQGQVIKGWDVGVQGMKVGGKRTLIIPASMAYGARARGAIPANARLIFDVELFDVKASSVQ